MTDKLKSLLEDSGVDAFVNRGTYAGSSGWPFVGMISIFVVAYVVGEAFGWNMQRVEGLAGLVIGHQFARTYRRA